MKIDAHQHFWKYNTTEYVWIEESMSAIRRDFLPENLKDEIQRAAIDGTVSVQARQSLKETEWLIELAKKNDFILGIVGWLPLKEDKVEMEIERFSICPKFKAVRHVVQEEPKDFLADDKFNRGVRLLKKYNLAYDILIFSGLLPEAIQFADKHPEQIFILDHMAKPEIKTGKISEWKKLMKKLAERENVYCKISGMATEAHWQKWTIKELAPYFESVLEFFTPKRLMFGSDWPVCLNACAYERWLETVEGLIAPLSENEKKCIMGKTAIEAYNL